MLASSSLVARVTRKTGIAMTVVVLSVAACAVSLGQETTTAIARAVGGISVDANGILAEATVDGLDRLSQLRKQSLGKAPKELNEAVPLRKVSLRRLEAAIERHMLTGKELPDEIQYLAGLQRIQYVFVYPEQQDIVLVGPGEGWKADKQGNIVGVTTGRPVMWLDDLVVALRTARQAANGGITCSIDPTPEGIAQFTSFIGQSQAMVTQYQAAVDPDAIAAGGAKAMGLQNITLTNVPADTHFARVLVAADYRMKRLGMGFEEAPIRGLPSFLSMVRAGGNTMPRWWLEPSYDPILRSPDGLAWELRGASVKAMTEQDFVNAHGNVERSGKADPIAQRWADNMTEKYEELAAAMPIFGELRNCMELAIVGALVVKEQLPQKAGYSMPALLDPVQVKTVSLPSPKQVDSKVSLLRKGRNWVISASGGVALDSWAIAGKTQQSDAPATARTAAAPAETTNWWWN